MVCGEWNTRFTRITRLFGGTGQIKRVNGVNRVKGNNNMADYLEIARAALALSEVPRAAGANTQGAASADSLKTEAPTDPITWTGISWAEWKAVALNRLFQEQGVTGKPGRITAATVRHGEAMVRNSSGGGKVEP